MANGSRYPSWVWAAIGVILLSAAPARAGLIVAVQFTTANVGSTGNPLEVTLQNTGAPVTVGGFNFTISISDTDITFTGSDFSTTPHGYIFFGDSFDQANLFTLNTLSPGQSMDGTDLSNSGNGVVVGTNATVGLGRVLFDVAPNAVLGTAAIALSGPPGTSLSDQNANNLTINTFNNGQISVQQLVPEPGTALLLVTALAGVAAVKRRA